jgi:hypothetical protein
MMKIYYSDAAYPFTEYFPMVVKAVARTAEPGKNLEELKSWNAFVDDGGPGLSRENWRM